MGSLMQNKGLIFKPDKVKSQSTKAKIGNINKYLFKATLEVLKFIPIASADSHSGAIITDWYVPKESKHVQFKIMVYIKDELITPEGIEVIVFERQKLNSKEWSKDSTISNEVSSVIEDKIIRKARDLYLQSER
jgi:hypothetical protein